MRGLVVRLALAACASAGGAARRRSGRAARAGYIVYDVHPRLVRLQRGEARHEWKLDKGATRSRSRSRPGARRPVRPRIRAAAAAQWTQRACARNCSSRPARAQAETRQFDWTAARSASAAAARRRNGEIRAGDQDLLSLWHQARKGGRVRQAGALRRDHQQEHQTGGGRATRRGAPRSSPASDSTPCACTPLPRRTTSTSTSGCPGAIACCRSASITDDKGGVLDQRARASRSRRARRQNPN